MISIPIALRRFVQIAATAGILISPLLSFAQCEGIKEEGRWRNLDKKGDPAYIDVKMTGGCGDEVLNGASTGSSTSYTMKVWIRQPSGQFYGRPTVKAFYRLWKREKWLRGNVYTGGYQDQMWLHVEERNGRPQLHVFIRHESLDSKPSAQSEYWYTK